MSYNFYQAKNEKKLIRMKKVKLLSYICIMVLLGSLLVSCTEEKKEQNEEEIVITLKPEDPNAEELEGKKPDDFSSWAAIYEETVESLSFNPDGSATYKGTKYDSYTVDDNFITLKGSEEVKMRYVMKRKKMLLYDSKLYKYITVAGTYDGPEAGSLVGLWRYDNHYSYEFTEKGTFYEDENFPGHYSVNEEDHTIKLMYNDQFEDTYLYYSLDGDMLTIEYPWSMVPTKSEDQ